jgi:lysyl-tRNA synthetase class 2
MTTPRWKRLKEDARLRENLAKRARIVAAIRTFFDAHGYLEVETPLLVARPGMEPYLDPFETDLHDPAGKASRGFLITSPEYAMKKLLVAGLPRLYQLAKCFRNGEDSGGRHNPEFTMLEWYRTGTDYRGIMDETEALVKGVARASTGSTKIRWGGREIDLDPPWERLSVRDAFKRYADLDLDEAVREVKVLIRMAQKLGHRLSDFAPFEDAFFSVFLNAIEPKLGLERPTILYDYPARMAALSKVSERDPRYCERFELYIGGLEIANAFTELTDAKEQRRRLEEEHALRKRLGKSDYGLDEDFLAALGEGMPEAGGIALGVDRLVMLLLGEEDIRNVLAFPADSMFTGQGP